MRDRERNILVTVGWALMMASVILQALYERLALETLDLVFLFFISVVAGVVLIEADAIIYGWLGSLLMSAAMIFAFLTLPATLGVLGHVASGGALATGATVVVFRSMILPSPTFLICLVGGLAGGFIGERFRLR